MRTRGRWPPPEGPRVAIVGSRRPSPYGEAAAEQLALELAHAGVIVVSGLALGIDGAAHRGALNGGGVTVAVMGTGVDLIYPSAHVLLAEAILAGGGALVSQFADGTAPRRQNFPARNYTMAALSDVVVVVEAGEGSGALITAEAALDLHKSRTPATCWRRWAWVVRSWTTPLQPPPSSASGCARSGTASFPTSPTFSP